MEAIVRTLFNELARRHRVILPGLGTLSVVQKQEQAASGGDISVPYTAVQFTGKEEAGETLPELIARFSGIPIKDIKPRYNRWISRLTVDADQGRITITGVVTLIPQADGSYLVKADKQLDDLLNPIGQKNIHLPVLSTSKPNKKSAKPKDNSPKAETTHSDQTQKSSGKKKGALPIVLLIVILLVGGLGYYGYTANWFGPQPEKTGPPVLPVEPVRHDAEPVAAPDTIAVDTVIHLASPDIPPVEDVRMEPEKPTGDVYHVIAGVFSTRENAERFVREKKLDPENSTIIPTVQGQFMVSAGKYTDKPSADAEMARLQKTIPETWISKRKK